METPDIVFSPPGSQEPDVLVPMFRTRAIQNAVKTKQQGRPIFDEVEWVDIYIPGDKNNVISKKVTDEHRKRWAIQYKDFVEGREQTTSGTPLEHWPPLNRAQVAELKAMHIHSVEALANMDDPALQRYGHGARELKLKAETFIAAASEHAIENKLAEQLEQKQQEIDTLREQVNDLAKRLDGSEEVVKKPENVPVVADAPNEVKPKRKPGRPRKNQ